MGSWPDDLHEIERALLDGIVGFEPGRHHYHGDAPLGDIWAAQVESRVLERYAEWRKPDQDKLVAFTNGLVRLFGSERPSVRALRNLGMLGFDFVPGVRRAFARHTMGLAGRLPRLSRGIPLS